MCTNSVISPHKFGRFVLSWLDGTAAFHVAATVGHLAVVRLLFELGSAGIKAHVNKYGVNGCPLGLHRAYWWRHLSAGYNVYGLPPSALRQLDLLK